MTQVPATHCRRCGRPFTEVRRYYRRALCWDCGLADYRARAAVERKFFRNGVYRRCQRYMENQDLKIITGAARLLRQRRIARYRRCVERGVPIEYEPRDEF